MAKEVLKNLFVGTDADCGMGFDFTIHACKTCHQKRIGYKGSLPSTHLNYLILEDPKDLYLNMVDMAQLLPKYTDPIMYAALNFIDKYISTGTVLIHCNQGISRSAGIALLYMAVKGFLPNSSYDSAKSSFMKIYPFYNPGIGVDNYLRFNWSKFVK